ncbi:MAG: SRPBCC family protein [Microthrixaceae bacterium]
MEIVRTADIAAPAATVWSVMSDVEQWHTWTASVTSVELTDPGPIGVGSRAEVRQPRLPRVIWTVTEWRPGRSFTWEQRSPGARAVGVHTVESTGEGTSRVTLTLRQEGPVGSLVGRLFRGLSGRYVDMEAAGLAARSEAPVS